MNQQTSTPPSMAASMALDIYVNSLDGKPMNLYLDKEMTKLVMNLTPTAGSAHVYKASAMDVNTEKFTTWHVMRWDRLFVESQVQQ